MERVVSFPGGSVVKNPLPSAGDVGLILGWEDPLEKEMATHSSTLAWKIPWTEEPGGPQFMGLQRVGHNLVAKQQNKTPWFRMSPVCLISIFVPGVYFG